MGMVASNGYEFIVIGYDLLWAWGMGHEQFIGWKIVLMVASGGDSR